MPNDPNYIEDAMADFVAKFDGCRCTPEHSKRDDGLTVLIHADDCPLVIWNPGRLEQLIADLERLDPPPRRRQARR